MGDRIATVAFSVQAETAFDYLVDPANRPEWQSSLRAVELAEGAIAPGLTWVDVTMVPGVRPLMVLSECDRPRQWTETGSFRGVRARLRLDFVPTPAGCDVTATFRVHGLGLGGVLTAAGGRAVTSDLRRAARILASP